MTKKNNMEIWDAVSKTDPKHTKKVEFGRKFTAIDAHYQIRTATEQFGPIGIGWGYTAEPPIFTPYDIVIVPVTLWHGDRANVFGPVYGAAEMVSNKGRKDHDAPKKATTDAITKLLSQLGFNADVFLGMYDDNKYVQEMTQEFAAKADPNTAAANGIMAEMEAAADAKTLDAVLATHKDTLAALKVSNPAMANTVASVYKKRKGSLNE